MANNFCRFLSNGYRFKSEGTKLVYQPCCWYSKEIPVLNNPDFHRQKNELSQVNDWIPECESCRKIEATGAYGNRSPRLRSFEEITDSSVPDNVPVWIELSIDTTCNAACIMCGPWHSTTWRRQEIKFGIRTAEQMPDLVPAEHWWTELQKQFSFEHVRSVSFLGGEPFESSIPLTVLRFLKQINGSLKDITIHFQTNGSIKPSDEVMELAAECLRVKFNLSIDAVGPKFEYIRYPILWHKLEKVIEHVKSLRIPNIRFVSLATINPLNIIYYDELECWISKTFNESKFLTLKPNKSVGQIDISYTPLKLRLAVNEKFGSEHPVTKLISNVSYWQPQKFVKHIDWLDSNRRTNWRATFPEIVKYFE